MIIEGNKVIFEADEETIAALKAASFLLGDGSEDKLLKLITRYLVREGLRRFDKKSSASEPGALVTDLGQQRQPSIEDNLTRWASRGGGLYFNIIKAYLFASRKNDYLVANFDEMKEIFLVNYSRSDELSSTSRDALELEARFIRNFRMLCTNSPRAFGKLFDYDRNEKSVRINPQASETLLKLKDAFTA